MNRYLFKLIIIIYFIFSSKFGFSQYSGTYTVGGTSPNFKTLTIAFGELTSKGISGNVRLNVRSGTYTERMTLYAISGANSSNTIKIAPDPNNTSPVIFKNGTTSISSNYIFNVNTGSFIEFDSIQFKIETNSKYGRIFDFTGNCQNITFDGCTFYGRDTASAHENFAILYDENSVDVNNYNILNCSFFNGSLSIIHWGNTSDEKGFVVKNCNMYNYYSEAIHITYQKSPIIEGNYSKDNNKFATPGGIYLGSCDSCIVKNNRIYLSRGQTGLVVGISFGSAKSPNLIINNIINIYDSSKSDVNCTGLYITGGSYNYVYYNTVVSYNKSSSSKTFRFYPGTGSVAKNNNIVSKGGGYAIDFGISKSGINSIDYNNYYTIGSNLGYYSSSNLKDLAAIKTFTAMDKNSISYDMRFRNLTDLRMNSRYLDSAGTPISGITTDYDGQTRNSTHPDIGADEFVVQAPLKGTYTIGGTSPDFPNIDSAFNYAEYYGISGNVRFNVRSGTYIGQTTIDSIEGASNSSIIKICPDPSNTYPVVFKYKITSLAQNHIFNVQYGFFEFDSITFTVDSTSTYGRVFYFSNNCENVKFNNCTFYGHDASSFNGTDYYNILTDGNKFVSNYKIENCRFYNGGVAIMHQGNSSKYEKNCEIKFNKFINFTSSALYLKNITSPIIQGNYIKDRKLSFMGDIWLENADSFILKENRIFNIGNNPTGAVIITDCQGSATSPNLIANNYMVSLETTSSIIVLNLSGGKYNYITYNTIVVNHSPIPTSNNYCIKLIQNVSGQNSVFKNNNVVNFGKGYTQIIPWVNGFKEIDYNNYYTAGKGLAEGLKTIGDIQTFSGMEAHSVSSLVHFKSYDSYINDTYPLDSNANVISSITTDIDGKPRDKKKPDIGAYEFSLPENDLGVLKIITSENPGCGSDSTYASIIIKNIARFPQKNFKVCLTIKDSNGKILVDTFNYTNTFKSQQIDTIDFKKFFTRQGGKFTLNASVILKTDTINKNDTSVLSINLASIVETPDEQSDTICDNQTYTLTTKYPSGTFLRWYDSKVGGKVISDTSTIDVKNLKQDTKMYMASVRPGTSPDSITTSPNLNADLACPGIMFDIVPKINLSIDSFASFFKTNYSHTVTIFIKNGTYRGFEKLKNTWKAIDTINLKLSQTNIMADIHLKKSISLKKDSVYGFYITYSGLGYASTSISQDSNTDIRVKIGSSLCGFFDSPNYGRSLVGKVYYRKYSECESVRVPYSLKVNKKPQLYLGKDTSYCEVPGISMVLNGGPKMKEYNWSTFEKSSSIIIKKDDKYGITITDSNNCKNSDTITIRKFSNPIFNIGKDTIYCKDKGINYTLNAGSGYTKYLWNTRKNTQTIKVESGGVYIATITNTNNCEASDTLIVSNFPEPNVMLGNDTAYCSAGSKVVLLDAGSGFLSYLWLGGEKSRTLNISKSGLYGVTVSDNNNCSASDKIFIAINENPKIDLGKDVSYCINKGINLVLDAGFGFKSYLWSTSDSSQKITVNSSGSYLVNVVDANNCNGKDSIIVIGNKNPVVNLGSDMEFISGSNINETLDAGAGFKSYKWNTSATTQKIVVVDEGIYFVKVIDNNGCEGTDTISIKYKKPDKITSSSRFIKISPNPSNNLLNIYSGNLIIENIKIYDIRGEFILKEVSNRKDIQLDISSLSEGIYFLNVYTTLGTDVIKFIVKR